MISLTDARRHLRIDGSDFDEEIQQKLDAAAALVVKYANLTTTDAGTDAATLLILGELWMSREAGADPLSPSVQNILNLYRPVVFA